jgi:hypothetical protein
MSQITASFRQSALRRGIVVATKNKTAGAELHLRHAATLEMANLGFLVNPEDLTSLSTAALTNMIADARKVIGADRNMKPIYPGFPKQVEDLDTLTLWVEQIMHYLSGGTLLPNYPDVVREGLPLKDMLRNARKVSVLPAAQTARELTEGFTTSAIALSADDKAILKGAIEIQHPSVEDISRIAKNSRNGENMQTFLAYTREVGSLTDNELLEAVVPYTDNVDQLLRVVLTVASAPSAAKWVENYNLAVGTLADRNARAVRMGKLSKPARRLIVARLGKLTEGFYADRLVTRQNLWRGVMRAVHPYDFKLSESEKRAADVIHSNIEYRTFNSLVEDAIAKGKVKKAAKMLAKHQPGNLLRRVVALLRLVKNVEDATVLADAIRSSASSAALTTLISAYNGVISANDNSARVTRVAGLTNTMVQRDTVKVKKAHLKLVVAAVKDAITENLSKKDAPAGPVAVVNNAPVPLVRRDAATADRTLDRGQEIGLVGKGDILRMFGHWNNNQSSSGYMDIGVVVLDEKFEHIAVSTWNSWDGHRDWSTYSGDKHVYPGDSAPEFIDVKLSVLRKKYPQAKFAAMTVQSWSGWPINNVDFIAGAMLRSDGNKGEVFDARSVTTAFKPTTEAMQSVPFAVNLETGMIIWIDSSNGSMQSGVSSTNDSSIGGIVYDEIARPRLTLGDLAEMWASAHGVDTVQTPADRDALVGLLD